MNFAKNGEVLKAIGHQSTKFVFNTQLELKQQQIKKKKVTNLQNSYSIHNVIVKFNKESHQSTKFVFNTQLKKVLEIFF